MATFNFKKSFSLINAAIGGRDVLSEQLIQAHRAGVDPIDWYGRYTKSLIEDHTQGIIYPLLVITTATKEQSHGLNKGKKAGDDMLDLSVGAGKTIKNRIGQWENLVRVGINPKENEVFSAWAARSAAMVESFKTINALRLSMGFPMVDVTDHAGRLHDIMQLHDVLEWYQEKEIANLARELADAATVAAYDADATNAAYDATVAAILAASDAHAAYDAAVAADASDAHAAYDAAVAADAAYTDAHAAYTSAVADAAVADTAVADTVTPTVADTVTPTVADTATPTVADTKDIGPKHGTIVSRDTRKKMERVLVELEGKYSIAEMDCLLTLMAEEYQPVMLAA